MIKICESGHITGHKKCHCGAKASLAFYQPGHRRSTKDAQAATRRSNRLEANSIRVSRRER